MPLLSDRLMALESLRTIETADAKREREAQSAAFSRLMAALCAACPNPVVHGAGAGYSCEPHLPGIAARLLANTSTDDDLRVVASMAPADLLIYGVSAPQFICMMASIYEQF